MAQHLRNIALRTSLIYALLAGLWILLSDRVISFIAKDAFILTQMQTYKGLFFVTVTTALLYVLLRAQLSSWRREAAQRQETQQALAFSNDYLKAVLDSTNDAILVIAAGSGKIIDTNQRLFEIFGYTREEAVNKPVHQLSSVLMQYPDKTIIEFAAKSKSEGPQVFEWQVRQKDGRLFWVEVNMRFITIGCEERYVVSVRNINDRKEIETSLKENQRMLSTLVSNLPGMVYRCKNDPDWRTMEYISEGVFALTGYRREDLLGNNNITYGKIIHPEDRQRVWDEIQEAVKHYRPFTLVYRIIDASNIEKWVWEQGRGIFDENDKLLSLEGFITDISEQKENEEKLREVNTRLNVLINSTPDIICFKDEKNRWLEVNTADLHLFRLTGVDYRGKTDAELADYTDPLYREAFLTCEQSDENAWRAKTISRGEEAIPTPDGDHKVYDVIKAPIFNPDGSRKGLIVFGRDITEKKKAEQALYKRISELEALRTIDRAITSSFNIQITLDILLKQAIHKLDVDAAAILVLDPDLQLLKYVACEGFRQNNIESTEIRPGQGLAGTVMLERRILQINDAQILEKDKSFAHNEGFQAYYGIPLIARGQMKGILEIFLRANANFDSAWSNFLETLADQTAIAVDTSQMFDILQHKNLELAFAYDATIAGWAHALELHEGESHGHSQRTTEMTVKLAQSLGLGQSALTAIRHGVLLHDVGKMGIPERILLKKGALTPAERKVIEQHPIIAREMLSKIDYLRQALIIPYYHHEKWDGSGYPEGLREQQIPQAARIFAIIDVWDALTSDRPYRKAWPQEKALAYIREQRGKHFEPAVVDAFLNLVASTSTD